MAEMPIEKLLVLSTTHLSPKTCNEWLHSCPWAAFEKGDYGWFVYVAEDTEGVDVPLDLRSALHVARREGCEWVMFDCDASTIDELPTFEWEEESPEPNIFDILPAGFEPELAGGGCTVASRYWPNGPHVWATCLDGGGLPTVDNWIVCTYPADWDGDQETILVQFTSDADPEMTLLDAIAKATAVAEDAAR
jgi:hypothetical protein